MYSASLFWSRMPACARDRTRGTRNGSSGANRTSTALDIANIPCYPCENRSLFRIVICGECCARDAQDSTRLRGRLDDFHQEEFMNSKLTRRSLLGAGASLWALGALPVRAQAKTKLRFSAAFTEQDLRAEAYKAFADAIKGSYDFEPYWGNTLLKQGTEHVDLQRGNL